MLIKEAFAMMEPHAHPLADVETRTFDPAFGEQGLLDRYFEISARGSTQRQEFIAGVTTFLAMVYSVFVVPGMLGKAGFDTSAVFVAVCLTTAFGSLLMGVWARLPIAIGCAISLTAFTAFGLVLGKGLHPTVALGAANDVGLVMKNPGPGLPVSLGHITSLPALMSVIGLAAIVGLVRRRVPG